MATNTAKKTTEAKAKADPVEAPAKVKGYAKTFKVLARAISGDMHAANAAATRQEAINHGFTPTGDVTPGEAVTEPGEDSLPERKRTVAVTYTVPVVPTTLAGASVQQ